MLTMSQFAKKMGKSRQRIHILMNQGRIHPKPKLVGSYYLVDPKAKLTSVNGKRTK